MYSLAAGPAGCFAVNTRKGTKMKHELFLLDIDTQLDFFLPQGSRYTPQARTAGKNVRHLFEWAWTSGISVISTLLRVRPSELGLMGTAPFCVEGTEGERKLPGTILPRCIDLGLRNITDLPREIFQTYQQVVFERRLADIFSHAALERLVTEAGPGTFVVCGAGVTKGILQAALGLRHRGLGVVLATDAIVDLEDEFTEMAYRRMEAKGVVFRLTEELTVPKHEQPADRLRTAEAHLQSVGA